ncbi:hypothetical protein Tco_1391456 [Tanacetum coccineum]
MDDIISSDDEWEESDYGNPPNTYTNTESLFKPYLDAHKKGGIGKEDERIQKKRKGNNSELEIIPNKAPESDYKNDENPNKRVCKAKKFEAIKYLLGPNEEYIAIKSCEYNAWERSKDSVSHIYQDIFRKQDKRWTMTRTME